MFLPSASHKFLIRSLFFLIGATPLLSLSRGGYLEPDLSRQSPGDLWEIPCSAIRPQAFQRLFDFMPLGDDSRCGYLTLPQAPGSNDRVHLFWILFPALHPDSNHIEPLVFLTGGPGQPGTYLPQRIGKQIQELRSRQDYLLIDYRGSGMSVPTLYCEGIGSFSSEEEYLDTVEECREDVLRRGAEPSSFTTSAIASDIQALLQALGYSRADFQAVSYGAKVGLTLMRNYPEWVRSMILDSPLPPEAGGWAGSEEVIFNPLDNILLLCDRSPDCRPSLLREELVLLITRILHLSDPESGKGGVNLIQALRNLDHDFHQGDWPVRLTRLNRMNDREFLDYLRIPSGLSAEDPPLSPSATEKIFREITGHRKDPLLTLATHTDFRGLWYSIACQEGPLRPTPSPYSSPYFLPDLVTDTGKKLDRVLRESGEKTCQRWGVEWRAEEPPPSKKTMEREIPVLILNAAVDPHTPLVWAQRLQEEIPLSALYVSETGSHDVGLSDPCALPLILDFLQDPRGFLKPLKKPACSLPLRYTMGGK